MRPICCPALHSTSLAATSNPSLYCQNPNGASLIVCLCGFHNQDNFRSTIIDDAYSDYTKIDVVMPAHVVTGASINPSTSTGYRSGFLEALA